MGLRVFTVKSAIIAMCCGLAALAIPAAASAADTISVTAMGSPVLESGLLSITFNSTTPIVLGSVTAHIFLGNTPELTVTTFMESSSNSTSSTWTVSTPIATTAPLALGIYTVTVDASDSGLTSITGVSAPGTFDFLIGPEINNLITSPANLSFDHQAYAVSGVVVGAQPDGTTAPVTAVNVYAQATKSNTPVGGPVLVGTTSVTDGSFSGSFKPPMVAGFGSPDGYYLLTNATSIVRAGQTASQPIVVNADPLAIKTSLSPKKIKYGQTVTMTGSVHYTESASIKVAAAVTVNITGGTGLPSGVTVKTSTAGTFSVKLPRSLSTRWLVQAGGMALTPWFLPTTTGAQMAVAAKVTVQFFRASLSPLGQLSYNLCLSGARQWVANGPYGHAEIEYAAGPHGPWKNFSRATLVENTQQGSPCYESFRGANGVGNAAGKVKAKRINSFYRAVYSGNAYYQPVTSQVVHAWLELTRITNFNVTPRSIPSGGKFTVTGKLGQQHGRSWRAYAHRLVGVVWYNSAQGVNIAAVVKTNANGAFRAVIKFTGSGSAKMFALYPGDKTHLYSASNQIRFTVGQATPAARLYGGQARWLGQIVAGIRLGARLILTG